MTAPARMTPEREAELQASHWSKPDRGADQPNYCGRCFDVWPCHTVEALDALAAERAHAQQVEVMHSSAAVLGYVACYVGDLRGLSSIAMKDTLKGITDYIGNRPHYTIPAAVVRIGADGRIGGAT